MARARPARPIGSTQVVVVGSNIGGLSNTEDVYTIRGAPAGSASVRVLILGYSEARQNTRVLSGVRQPGRWTGGEVLPNSRIRIARFPSALLRRILAPSQPCSPAAAP